LKKIYIFPHFRASPQLLVFLLFSSVFAVAGILTSTLYRHIFSSLCCHCCWPSCYFWCPAVIGNPAIVGALAGFFGGPDVAGFPALAGILAVAVDPYFHY
jgi:hypothetical protein